MSIKIYIAGPDVFRKNFGQKELAEKVSLCKKYGFIGIPPIDENSEIISQDREGSLKIFDGNMDKLSISDIIVADFNPFRGACVDDGTSTEVMAGYLKNKIVYGYHSLCGLCLTDILPVTYGEISDTQHPLIEKFGNPVNLMLVGCVYRSGGKILSTFEECLLDIKENH